MEKDKFYLCLTDMVANAFIEINKNGKIVNELPLKIIEEYGFKVANKLQKEGNNIIFGLSRNNTEHFVQNYKNYFETKIDNLGNYSSIILKDNIEIETLIEKFRTYMPLKLLLAYMDTDVVSTDLLENNLTSKKLVHEM